MPKFFIAALALFLLISAGGGGSDPAHARSIPWECSDWQAAAAVADAEDARVSVILESLAANRGKTLYCAVDQSDTFTKAETWQAGKDRNERDDTVYQGQNGRFRGFLAAQEGYLTDGESGVTGISRDRVFEFPEEPKKKRRYRTVRLDVGPFGMSTAWGPLVALVAPNNANGQNNPTATQTVARNQYNGANIADDDAYWQSTAQSRANHYCTENPGGYQRATNARPTLAANVAVWAYGPFVWNFGKSRAQAYKTNSWTATCVKRVRR